MAEFFCREYPFPLLAEDPCAKAAGNFDRAVARPAIENNMFVRQPHALEQPSDVRFLVIGNDHYGEGHV